MWWKYGEDLVKPLNFDVVLIDLTWCKQVPPKFPSQMFSLHLEMRRSWVSNARTHLVNVCIGGFGLNANNFDPPSRQWLCDLCCTLQNQYMTLICKIDSAWFCYTHFPKKKSVVAISHLV
jgi:hypothetical protein